MSTTPATWPAEAHALIVRRPELAGIGLSAAVEAVTAA